VGIIVRAVLFNVIFYLSSIVIGLMVFPFIVLPPAFMRWAGAQWSHYAIWLLKVIVGAGWEVRGEDRIPDGPAIFGIKHQSAWDTMFFPVYFGDPAMICKKELRLIPFYGWFAWRAGAIWIDRKGGAGALRTLIRGAIDALKHGRSVVMFPQGTRTLPGETRPYQPGVTALYSSAGVPVVPVALNSGMFWPKRTFTKQPGTIVVEFLDPMPPGLDRAAFLETLAERIDSATARLEAEARS
jgi:1-acyl-sn-glycerol-3-phosphate acyltransferase